MKRHDFPKDFCFGTATASYQVEGAVLKDGRGTSIWDTFSHTPGKVKHGDTGDVSCDHYHRFTTDLDLMKDLGVDAYRLSIAWPRVMPEGTGAVNAKGLAFYDRLIDGLLGRGITPWVTVYHWDLPQALEDKHRASHGAGWGCRDTALALGDYANVVVGQLGDRVKNWITVNEPWCAAYLGHGAGIHAPGHTDLGLSLKAAHHLLLAHGLAVQAVRANSSNAKVGITLNLNPAYAQTDSSEDAMAASRFDGFFNRWYLDPVSGRGYPADMLAAFGPLAPEVQPDDLETIAAETDFLGINYYSRTVVKHDPQGPLGVGFVRPEQVERTFLDWEVFPQGLTDLLLRLSKDHPGKPLYITENGASYDDQILPDGRIEDEDRRFYFERHLQACLDAMAGGVDLRGYFAWSLLDNFEWAEGYEKRFGLIHVDFETQQRTIKRSGHWYADLLRNH